MQIDVVATAQLVNSEVVEGKTVVVIDVLRATSVMITALQNGAKAVIPVTTPDEAFEMKKQLGRDVLLGGERMAEPIPGFDFGNSPLSYTADVVSGKTLVMTTTNGTLAINNSLTAQELIVASFINSDAVCQFLSNKEDVIIVCSGNNGLYTLEDALCAGQIIYQLQKAGMAVQCTDFALAQKALYESHRDNLGQLSTSGYHYNVLQQKGYVDDLAYCFETSISKTIPVWNGQALVSYK
ncbi:2-phosphosulfolactate phosphatase [Carboxylicivirga sediminis]|uniref:Probable 2-phosphosulfolactate phosphatase n=1 Tax=Carboxylicivirga sediminis TaxID=2006564 RepID=A0A941F4Q8_9BACT|nr:2-phosphosulfolactate phosphatase [Carboxylicivirga sediminis]MBR8536751.1 2-phosphosulfolactate phosphatase [Carboxylicivirga sediminis]